MSKAIKSVGIIAATVVAIGVVVSPAQATPKGTAKMIERLDTDASGTISLEEYLAARSAVIERVFDRRDKNADGAITEDEYGSGNSNRSQLRQCIRTALGSEERPTWEQWLAEVDTDLDGSVNLGEFSTEAQAKNEEQFAAIDTDASGDITETEIDAAREARKAERKAQRDQLKEARKTCVEQLGLNRGKKRGKKNRKN